MSKFPLAGMALVCAWPVLAQQPLPPDQQAEVALTAGRKAYADGNLPAAMQQFQTVVQKFPNVPQANAARYGLGLCLINSPEPDYAKAAELFQAATNDGGLADRGQAFVQLGVCHRLLGLKELDKPGDPNPKQQAANQRFNQAFQAFAQARDWFNGKKDDDAAARARCDVAEMELRLGKVKEARGTCEPFLKDAALAKVKARNLGLYYHGLACFLDNDPTAAGRSLNLLAPFTDPAFGTHARYLVGRVLHLSGESAEASVHYDGVLADFTKARTDATQTLNQPDKFKNNPIEKTRLEVLARGTIPEYVAGAAFHGACLNYEAGKFAEALTKFQSFAKDFPASKLQPDAVLRAGFCFVQLKQYDEAAKLLAPTVDKTPRLADQTLFWFGKAQLGLALAADPANPADRDNKLKAALATLKLAADKANQLAQQDPEAKARRHEMLLDLADGMQLAKLFPDAVNVYESLWNEQALPTRREEVLQRLATAAGAANQIDKSNQRVDEFRRTFPQSVLTPQVMFRGAENAFAKAVELAKNKNANPADLKQNYITAVGKYKEVVDKYPEFERVNYARFGQGVCLVQLGQLEDAAKIFDAIPGPDRAGDLAQAGYLLADCLIRLAPARADDALQENQIREKLSAAAQLLESFAAANPKSPDAPAALLKLGLCTKRLGASLADNNERNQTLNRAREIYEKLSKDYPQSPYAGQAVLERAKVRALMGDRGGAMNDLRAFAGNDQLRQSAIAPLAALHLATLYREENNPAEAAKVLDEARKRYEGDLAKDPERAEWAPLLKYHHAVAIFETQKPADARKLFDEVVQQSPGKPVAAEAALRSGQCRIAEGKKLIEAGQQARNQAGNDGNKQNAANQTIQQGRQAIQEAADGLYRRGEEFRNALPTADARGRMYYDCAWAWRFLAEEEINRAREAVQKQLHAKQVEEAQRKLPAGSPPPNLPMPDISRGQVPVQPAEERTFIAYRRLNEEFPEQAIGVDSRFELGELLADRGNHDDAAKLLKDALDKEPGDKPTPPDTTERIRLRLGGSLFAKKDYPAAASQFDAVAANPKSPYIAQALYRAGECRVAAGEFDKAIEKLSPFRDKPEFHNRDGVSDRAMLRLGQALAGAKQWEPSKSTLETMIQRFGPGNPLAPDARYGIGWALQNQSKYDDAIASYQSVIAASQSETAAKAQLQIGQCRMAQKKYADAAAAFLTVTYTYDYPDLAFAAALEAARAYTDDNKPTDAERVLRKVLKDAPKDSDWAKAANERLGQLKK